MPLVTVEDIRPPDLGLLGPLLEGVAVAVADALGRPRDSVWARFVVVEAARFGGASSEAISHPVVTIATGALPDSVVERTLRAAAEAAALSLGTHPEDVWVRFETLKPGSVLTNGTLQ